MCLTVPRKPRMMLVSTWSGRLVRDPVLAEGLDAEMGLSSLRKWQFTHHDDEIMES